MRVKKRGGQKTWQFPDNFKPTERERRVLVAKVARIVIHVLWNNFCYEFGGEIYLQRSGGPIGARITMACSRLVMQEWSENYSKILEASKVEVHDLRGYVDDNRQETELMRRGSRFNHEKKRFTWREDWEREDEEKNEPDEQRMGAVCLEGMNSVSSMLTFTAETIYNFENRMLATLDMQVEVIKVEHREEMVDQISFSYYQKPMKTPLVIGYSSAMGQHQKFSILSNEVIRRLSNLSPDRTSHERTRVIDEFTKELKSSGYSRAQAREVIVCGLLGLARKRKRREREGEEFYRTGRSTLNKRNLKRLGEKQNWFKKKLISEEERVEKKKEDRERIRDTQPEEKTKAMQEEKDQKQRGDPKSVIMVPYTPGSRLAKEMREVEEIMEKLTGSRFKIVEKTGVQLKRVLVNKNPWSGRNCLRPECLVCETREETGIGKGQACWKKKTCSTRRGVSPVLRKKRRKQKMKEETQKK